VLVVGATNRLESLDSALVRPGRFDRVLQLSLPEESERLQVLTVHARRTKLGGDRHAQEKTLAAIASATDGYSGAELANLLNEAAIRAVRARRDFVSEADLKQALGEYGDSRKGAAGACAGAGGAPIDLDVWAPAFMRALGGQLAPAPRAVSAQD
jgi:cell division protease FtsH|tara:strand:+ start:381 stop:845 length:465 start_codon:yes stop_codon:yes gene_type:complete